MIETTTIRRTPARCAAAWRFAVAVSKKAVAAASEADGKIVEKVESVFVDATDYSPLK